MVHRSPEWATAGSSRHAKRQGRRTRFIAIVLNVEILTTRESRPLWSSAPRLDRADTPGKPSHAFLNVICGDRAITDHQSRARGVCREVSQCPDDNAPRPG